MKLVIEYRELDRIIRASMHALNMAPPEVKKFPDLHVDKTLELIKENSLSITKYKEFEKLQKQWVRMKNIWGQQIKPLKIKIHESRIEQCARNLTTMRNGEIVERMGTNEVIIKKDGQYIIGRRKFENCWKAAKFLCK